MSDESDEIRPVRGFDPGVTEVAVGSGDHEPAATRIEIPQFWRSEALPEPMRHPSGHGDSHTFISAEFINALIEEREPEINVYHALAMTVPGLIAHQSALRGGEQLSVPRFDS